MRLGGNRVIERYRVPLNAAASPFVGDILLYLARGELLRSFIVDRVAKAKPPVVLVGIASAASPASTPSQNDPSKGCPRSSRWGPKGRNCGR